MDLFSVCLIEVYWIGVDLIGVILIGVKVFGVFCLGIKIEVLNCDWFDLSFNGDKIKIYIFNFGIIKSFFYKIFFKVKIIVDSFLDSFSYYVLVVIYY